MQRVAAVGAIGAQRAYMSQGVISDQAAADAAMAAMGGAVDPTDPHAHWTAEDWDAALAEEVQKRRSEAVANGGACIVRAALGCLQGW